MGRRNTMNGKERGGYKAHMKRSKILLLSAVLVMMPAMLFTGCIETPLTSKQKGWIKKLEKDYPDDSFTYVGHSTVSMGARSPSCISVKSENFPGVDIQIYEHDGELVSNYPLYYHADAVEEYFAGLVTSCFGCDRVEIDVTDTADKPLEYVSDEEYIEEYVIHYFTAYLYYEDGHDYPNEDEIESMVIDYLGHINNDNDSRGNQMKLCFCRPGVKRPGIDMDLEYRFSLHDGTASLSNSKEKYQIFDHESLEDLLA